MFDARFERAKANGEDGCERGNRAGEGEHAQKDHGYDEGKFPAAELNLSDEQEREDRNFAAPLLERFPW